jgi:hypothetical protein
MLLGKRLIFSVASPIYSRTNYHDAPGGVRFIAGQQRLEACHRIIEAGASKPSV